MGLGILRSCLWKRKAYVWGQSMDVNVIWTHVTGFSKTVVDSVVRLLAAPILKRLFGLDEITPELAERYADFVADMTLNGILTRPEEPT